MEAGELSIKGTLDTKDIVRGSRDINTKMDSIKQKTQSTNGSLSGLAATAGKVAGTFLAVGIAGVGALGALASKSPQLADEFAKIGVETFKIGNTLGGIFEPIFQDVVTGLASIGEALNNNEGAFKSWVNFGIVAAKGALSDLGNVMDFIGEKYDKFDDMVENKTGGTSFTEEFTNQVNNVTSNIQKDGLTGGVTREFLQTADSSVNILANLLGQASNKYFGTDIPIFDSNRAESNMFSDTKFRLFYNTDTTGD